MSDFAAAMASLFNMESSREEYVRAPFGYPGSKWKALDNILPHLPYRNSYCEPFGGTGAVLLARHSSNLEVFNDRYAGVTCFYRCLRDKQKLEQLQLRIAATVHSREEFIWCKNTWEDEKDEVERAAKWFYMTQNSFAKKGKNFARVRTGKSQFGQALFNSIEGFQPVHERLFNVQIENQDWRMCFKDYDSEDMVWYLDPPYYRVWPGLYKHELTPEEHKELLERIFMLRGFVAISSYPNALYDSYKWSEVYTWRQSCTILGMVATDTNNLAEYEGHYERVPSDERLYIR